MDVLESAKAFGFHVALVISFALVLGIVIRGHVAKELREGLEKSIKEAGENVAKLFKDALENAALPHFKEEVHRVATELVSATNGALGQLQTSIIRATVIEKIESSGVHKKAVEEAIAYISAKRYGDAEKTLLNCSTDDFDVVRVLVSLYRNPEVNRIDDAIKLLVSKEQVFRSIPRYYFELSVVYTDKEDSINAIRYSHQYVDLSPSTFPDGVRSRISLGYTYFAFKDYASGIVHTEKALSMLTGHLTDRLAYVCKQNLAFYYAEAKLMEKKEVALQYAEDAVGSDQNHGHYIDTRGYVRMQFADGDVRQLELARDDFVLAGQCDPGLTSAYKHLAEVNTRLKEARINEEMKKPA